MSPRLRERFDAMVARVIESIPPPHRAILDETPVIIEDEPSVELLEELGMDPELESLCGLHTGTPITQRSYEDGPAPADVIHLFREGIIDEAGGWHSGVDEDGRPIGGPDRIEEQIRITLLHELGHHFGLEEDDLDDLGYA